MRNGFTKIPKSLLDLPWAKNPMAVYLYTWLSLNADAEGRIVTSFRLLSKQTKLSLQQVRTAMGKLLATQVVTQVVTQDSTQVSTILTISYLNTCSDEKNVANTSCNTSSNTSCNTTSRAYKNDNILLSCLNEDNKENNSSLRSELFLSEEKFSFKEFWDLYDKKVGKEKSIHLYANLSMKDKEAIFKHIPRYKMAQPDKRFRKDPQTYLRNRSWEDEIITSSDDRRLYDNNTDKFKDGFSW